MSSPSQSNESSKLSERQEQSRSSLESEQSNPARSIFLDGEHSMGSPMHEKDSSSAFSPGSNSMSPIRPASYTNSPRRNIPRWNANSPMKQSPAFSFPRAQRTPEPLSSQQTTARFERANHTPAVGTILERQNLGTNPRPKTGTRRKKHRFFSLYS